MNKGTSVWRPTVHCFCLPHFASKNLFFDLFSSVCHS